MAMTVRYTTFDGEIVSENRNGVMRDYVPDPLGSTVALLDNTQSQTDTFTYWPYGEMRLRSGSTLTSLQFIGTLGYYRDNLNNTYVRARVLDTIDGRWLTTDPLSMEGNDSNVYRYAVNSPTTQIDPSGQSVTLGAGDAGGPVYAPPPERIVVITKEQIICGVVVVTIVIIIITARQRQRQRRRKRDCTSSWQVCAADCDRGLAYQRCIRTYPGRQDCGSIANQWEICCLGWCKNENIKCARANGSGETPYPRQSPFDCWPFGTKYKPRFPPKYLP